MKACIRWVLAVFLFSAVNAWAQSPTSPIVVLIPGFFNSLAIGYIQANPGGSVDVEPYFSDAVVTAIQSRGFQTTIVNTLDPIGTIAKNSALLLDFLHQLQNSNPGRSMILLGHSAGGLYALSALTVDPSLPVTKVFTVSTPFEGVRFIDKISSNVPLAAKLAKYMDLDCLNEMTAGAVTQFLGQVKIPANIPVIATGGTQDSCYPLSCYLAEKLSWLLSLTQAITGEPSDGIVAFSSALATNTNTLPIQRSQLSIHLEHWEQVQDYRLFTLLGTTDNQIIEAEQTRFYSSLAGYF